jgi:Rrf2 family protein
MTRKTDYALVAMAHLANAGSERVSARGIAERLGLPVPALMNILNQLGHAGLVTSTRGPNGGYGLAREPSEISLASLIEAVEGPVKLALCCNEVVDVVADERRCEIESACAIKVPVKKVHSMLRQFLSQVTLDQIATNRVPADLGMDLLNGVAGGEPVGAENRDGSHDVFPAGEASRSE